MRAQRGVAAAGSALAHHPPVRATLTFQESFILVAGGAHLIPRSGLMPCPVRFTLRSRLTPVSHSLSRSFRVHARVRADLRAEHNTATTPKAGASVEFSSQGSAPGRRKAADYSPARHVEVKQMINQLNRKKYVHPRQMVPVVQYMEKDRTVFLELRIVTRVRLLLRRLAAGNAEDYNDVMRSLAEMGLRDDCFEVYARMRKNMTNPDIETLNCLVLAAIRANRPAHEVDDVLNHFKKAFGIKANARTYAHRISEFDKKSEGIKKQSGKGDVRKAFALYESMKKQTPPIRPDIEVLNSLIAVCVRHREMKTADQLFKGLDAEKLTPDKRTYALMLLGYEREGLVKRAMQLVQAMRRTDSKPDSQAYGHLIGACGRAEEEERALKIFTDIKSKQRVQLDAALYGKVLDALAGKWKEDEDDEYQINDLWMASTSESIDDEGWDAEWEDLDEEAAILIREEHESQRLLEESRYEEQEREQEKEQEEKDEEERRQKEREEHSMTEQERQKKKETNERYVNIAFALLDDMHNRKVDPDYGTFFKLMKLCLKRDCTVRALDVFDLLKQEKERQRALANESPVQAQTGHAWTKREMQGVIKLMALKFIRGCEKNRDMAALETFLTKHSHVVEPEEEIYTAVLKAIANSYVPPPRKLSEEENDEDRAFIETHESGSSPVGDALTSNDKPVREGDWIYLRAWKLYHNLSRFKIKRNRDIYDSMIELACKRASIKRAISLLREMKQEAAKEMSESGRTTLRPSLRNYRSLIVHCLNNNYFNKDEEYNYRNDINHPLTKRAFELFEEMQDEGITPDIKIINAMLGCCARVEDKANGVKLLELLIRSNLVADEQTLKFKDRIQRL